MAERLEPVWHPVIVLVALLPVPGLGQFAVERFGEHGPAHVQIHLHAELMHDFGGAFGLFHVGTLIFRAESLVEINPPETHPGGGHALEIFRVAHPLVARGLVIEMVAAAEQEIQRFVRQPGDVPGSVRFSVGRYVPSALAAGSPAARTTRRELPQTRRPEESRK